MKPCVPCSSVAVAFVVYAVPPYLSLDPPRTRLQQFPTYAAVLPAPICVLIIVPIGLHGANQQSANTMLVLLWFGTTLAGFRAVRQHRYTPTTGQWMLRSVALVFSIIASRVWIMILFVIFVPAAPAWAGSDRFKPSPAA
jgi:hypothetical protein